MYEVRGKVSYRGAAVDDGTITFLELRTQYSDQAPLGGDGSYSLTLPPGSYQVAIAPVVASVGGGEGPPDWVYKNVQNIPKKYHLATTTDLVADIQEDALLDFDMTTAKRAKQR